MSFKKTLVENFYNTASDGDKYINFIRSKDEEIILPYKKLFETCEKILKHFQECGLNKGDEVIIQLGDNKSFICVYWACILGGLIPVPLDARNNKEQIGKLLSISKQLGNYRLVMEERRFLSLQDMLLQDNMFKELTRIEKRVLFYHNLKEDIGNGVIPKIEKDDIAFIQYSSGSTGNPKGVVLTHENLITNISGMISTARISDDDQYLNWMPLYHDMGLIGFHLKPLVNNLNQHNMSTRTFVKNPMLWLDKASEREVSILASPNFGYKYLLSKYDSNKDYGWNLSRIKTIFNGAEPIDVNLCRSFIDSMRKYGLKKESMYTVYGLAEASLAVAFPEVGKFMKSIKVCRNSIGFQDKVVESVDGEDTVEFAIEGKAVEGCDFRVADSRDEVLPEMHVGRIQIKGKNVTKGYYKMTDNKVYFSKDGWMNTGDLGFVKDGNLIVTGREKDIIIVQGQNYYLHDIERALEEKIQGAIDKIFACSIRGNECEEKLVVFIKNQKVDDVFYEMCRMIKRTINKEFGIMVHSILPIKVIPRTTSGKIKRYKLAEIYNNEKIKALNLEIKQALDQLEASVKVDDEEIDYIEKKLLQIWKSVLGNRNISIHDNFFDIGGNSTLLVELIANIDKEFPGKVLITDLFNRTTVKEIADFIRENSSEEMKYDKKITFDGVQTKKLLKISSDEDIKYDDFITGICGIALMKNQHMNMEIYMKEKEKDIHVKIDQSKQNIFDLMRDIRSQREKCSVSEINTSGKKSKLLVLEKNKENESAQLDNFNIQVAYDFLDGKVECYFIANETLKDNDIQEFADSFNEIFKMILGS